MGHYVMLYHALLSYCELSFLFTFIVWFGGIGAGEKGGSCRDVLITPPHFSPLPSPPLSLPPLLSFALLSPDLSPFCFPLLTSHIFID